MSAYRLLDTIAMPYEEPDSIPGVRRRLLAQDEATGATVSMNYDPPGFSPGHAAMLDAHGHHRHFHNTVRERHYVLAGDYPIWHWMSLDAAPQLTVLRRHAYLKNPPRTLHGPFADRRPQVATQMLVWNNSGGTSIFDEAAKNETFDVPLEHPDIDDRDWQRPISVRTWKLAWRAHGRLPCNAVLCASYTHGVVRRQSALVFDGMPAGQCIMTTRFAICGHGESYDGGSGQARHAAGKHP